MKCFPETHSNIDWYQQINPFTRASKLGPTPLEAIITDHHWWYMHLNECTFTKAMTAKAADAEAPWIGPLRHRQGPSQPLRLLQLQILFHCPYLAEHHYSEPHAGRPVQCCAMACTFDNWQVGTIWWAFAGCKISVFCVRAHLMSIDTLPVVHNAEQAETSRYRSPNAFPSHLSKKGRATSLPSAKAFHL